MRTGPFSDSGVIATLNRAFVPVFAVNEDYRDSKRAPAAAGKAEKAEYDRVFRDSQKAGFSTGTVHVYVLAPDGRVAGTMHVAEASKTAKLKAFLADMAARLPPAPGDAGEPLTPPRPQSTAPAVADGGLAIHVTARKLGGAGSWDGTAEDWVTFTPAEVRAWLPVPPPGVAVPLDPTLSERLLRHVYPVSENNDVAKNAIRSAALTARLLPGDGGRTRVRLDGHLVMRHDFYHKPDGKVVRTGLVGYADLDPTTGRVAKLRLTTAGATYNGGRFAVLAETE